jgi:penicillin-insensitive murein endopeptidase
MRVLFGLALTALCSVAICADAWAEERHTAERHTTASASIGAPNDGALLHGRRLPIGPHLRILPAYAQRDADWGLDALVALLDGAARDVRRVYPDTVTSFGDLSHRDGRVLSRHHSHESGRDADVAFFLSDGHGHAALPDAYIAIDSEGRTTGKSGLVFDDARNWTFVNGLLTNPRAHVAYIFVARWIRERLLRYGSRVSEPSIVHRAAEVLLQPSDAPPHDDHFHVRISCPPRMVACVELPKPRLH